MDQFSGSGQDAYLPPADLYICGDVLEHMPRPDAVRLLRNLVGAVMVAITVAVSSLIVAVTRAAAVSFVLVMPTPIVECW
ncbi:MAG: hypothetical protein ACR2F6_10375 [Mycobacteriales bacterium]